VVRGVAGRREEYRPVVSRLTPSAWPLDVARGFREHFGLTELYLADLDAIGGKGPALELYAGLLQEGFSLWVDVGIRSVGDAAGLIGTGIGGIVAGLETAAGPEMLEELCRRCGKRRVIFSLDLVRGEPLAGGSGWGSRDPLDIARRALTSGVGTILVLDLARVGVAEGTGTEELCGRLHSEYPEVQIAAGGGIRGVADLQRLEACGAAVALVASALHDGGLSREEIQRFSVAGAANPGCSA
jgi:phosphoribosylformimino-5-aminoimidazole carboxamide ribotide isomerase